jgi:hypothetical protein
LETTWEQPATTPTQSQKADEIATAKPSPFSPEGVASTFEIMKTFSEKLTEYKSCTDKTERRKLRLEILEIYTNFAVPSLSLAFGTFVSFPGAFVLIFIALQASGRGLPDLKALFASVPFVADALSHIDPSLGNAAVTAVLVELLSPVLILLAVAIKGRLEAQLREQLPRWGLDADGLASRIDALAGGEADLV